MKALLLLACLAVPQETRFTAVEVYVDSPQPLAAWQVEIRTDATIVGVEGGEPKAYAEPPYYDPKALQGGRIVLAAFTTDSAPPAGRVRVARLHLQEKGPSDLASKVVAAAAPGGARLDVKLELVRVK
jgi:hypothetical protein